MVEVYYPSEETLKEYKDYEKTIQKTKRKRNSLALVKLGDLKSLLTQVGGDHYKKMLIQPAEFINKNKLLFAEGNAIKYICSTSTKGGRR